MKIIRIIFGVILVLSIVWGGIQLIVSNLTIKKASSINLDMYEKVKEATDDIVLLENQKTMEKINNNEQIKSTNYQIQSTNIPTKEKEGINFQVLLTTLSVIIGLIGTLSTNCLLILKTLKELKSTERPSRRKK